MTWLRERSLAHVEAAMARLLTPLDARLRRHAIHVVAQAVVLDQRQDFDSPELLVSSLARVTERSLAEIERLESESASLLLSYQQALDESERREVLRRHLRATNDNRLDSRRDLSAVDRWLDIEAVRERYACRISQHTDEAIICYDCIATLLRNATTNHAMLQSLRRAGLLRQMLEHARARVRAPIRCAALRALICAIRQLEPGQRAAALGVSGMRTLADFARGIDAPRWVQLLAVEVSAAYLPEAALVSLLVELLATRRPDDGMVVRAGAIRQIAALSAANAASVVRLGLGDPSEHVRQQLAQALVAMRDRRAKRALFHLALKDDSPRVRGVGLTALVERAACDTEALGWTTTALGRCLSEASPTLVVRVALVSILHLRNLCRDVEMSQFAPALLTLANSATAPPEISEQAAATLRALALDDSGQALARELGQILATLDEGHRVRVRFAQTEAEVVAALRVAARGDHAVALRPLGAGAYQITRGEPRRLRLWRLWHELRNPMPDKRKGYVHSRARAPLGPYVITPVGMGEVTPTRVPGERVVHGRVGGWGPFLPRIDDLLTAALRHEPVRLVTAFGTVVVEGPRRWSARFRACVWLTHNYAKASMLRESALEAAEPRGQLSYVSFVRSLAFRIHRDDADDCACIGKTNVLLESPLVARYLGALGVAVSVPPDLLQQFFVHALSSSANTPGQLAAVIWLILVGFVLRATLIMHSIVRARSAIPLSIGGWGTRGKSGSERLKAALFHALRYDVVVKTTGCEAMFIHAQRDQPAQEIFIYRPYDKATIWEQRHMLRVAQQLRTQVFLWECMALQPRFVETLIDEWMKDPITTLTNAYPDHEDIQGPSGEDVARVIGRFMPRRGTTFTTEEQMLPLLSDAARRKGTQLIKVDPLQADLLPADLLARLPYQEHPRNVALVLALAQHFEIDREYALVEIADHVVLDLGVLKTYPEAKHRGRRLVFSNGMSANERAGFMSNWTRLGFDRHDADRDQDCVTVAVVNNRADRVARSRVFAQILVDDASLSSIVLINSNLGGMLTFIAEALEQKLVTLSLLGDGPSSRILERYDDHLRWLKVPTHERATEGALSRMLPALGLSQAEISAISSETVLVAALATLDAEALRQALETTLPASTSEQALKLRRDIVEHVLRQARRVERVLACRKAIEAAILDNRTPEIDDLFRSTYRGLFLDRITVLWNAGASGDQVVDFVTDAIPPGHLGRVLGCQNIKGTGLDFVYRWLSVDRVHAALQKLETVPGLRHELLAWLGSYSDFGLLDATAALTKLHEIRQRQDPSYAAVDTMLLGVIARLEQMVQDKQSRLHATGKADLFTKVASAIEATVDHLDSARRSRIAGRVMQDLFAARVGHGRAALLLRDITGRQKGGWLAKDLKAWFAKRHAPKSKFG
jgi:gamma-polyglutamate synthase